MSSDSKPSKAVADLEPFIGTWRNTGTMFDESGKEAGSMSATDTLRVAGWRVLHPPPRRRTSSAATTSACSR